MKSLNLRKLSLLSLLASTLVSYDASAAASAAAGVGGVEPGDVEVGGVRSRVSTETLAKESLGLAQQWVEDGVISRIENPGWWPDWCCCSAQEVSTVTLGAGVELAKTFLFDGGHAAGRVKAGDLKAIAATGREAVAHGISRIPDEERKRKFEEDFLRGVTIAEEADNIAKNGLTTDGVAIIATDAAGLAQSLDLVDEILGAVPSEVKGAVSAYYRLIKMAMPDNYLELVNRRVRPGTEGKVGPFYYSVDAAELLYNLTNTPSALIETPSVDGITTVTLYRDAEKKEAGAFLDKLHLKESDIELIEGVTVNPAAALRELATYWAAHNEEDTVAAIGDAMEEVLDNLGNGHVATLETEVPTSDVGSGVGASAAAAAADDDA